MIEILFKPAFPPLLLPLPCLLILFLLVAAFLVPHTGELAVARDVLVIFLSATRADKGRVGEGQVVELDLLRRVLVQLGHVEVLLEVVECLLYLLRGSFVRHSESL